MGVPVAQRIQAFFPHIPDCGQLFHGIQREMLRRGIRVAEKIDLFDVPDSVLLRSGKQAAGFIGQFPQGMLNQLLRVCPAESHLCIRVQGASPFRSQEGCS